MTHPYRSNSMGTARAKRMLTPNDGIAISVVAVMVGAVRVGLAVFNNESFGAEATIALVLLVLGLIGVAVGLWHR